MCNTCKTLVVAVFLIVGTCGEYSKCRVKLEMSICTVPHNNTTPRPCNKDSVCAKQFNISHVSTKIYGPHIFQQILQACCGSCMKSDVVSSVEKVPDITSEFMENVDFVFPVLGTRDDVELHGYHFIPIIETPRVYFISHPKHDILRGIISSCLNLWPLLLITALMVMISGFLCWIMETWGNRAQFPRGFIVGWFEGVWWSFISMTTVGYGDKAPKSVPARFFSIMWIIIGIATFSLITAALTSEIIAAESSPPPTMEDARVAVIRHHLYESILVANQGGVIVDVAPPNMTEGIKTMIKMLHKEEIEGFLLDRFALVLLYTFFSDDPRYADDVRYIRENTRLTDVTKDTRSHMYGALVKQTHHYHFFKDYITSNRDVIDSCNRLFLNSNSREVRVKQKRESLFSTKGEMFWPTFYSLSMVVAVIFVCGLVYELQRKKCGRTKEKFADISLLRSAGGGAF